jgi:hypothetical protein
MSIFTSVNLSIGLGPGFGPKNRATADLVHDGVPHRVLLSGSSRHVASLADIFIFVSDLRVEIS